jgi:hypothetical protein
MARLLRATLTLAEAIPVLFGSGGEYFAPGGDKFLDT